MAEKLPNLLHQAQSHLLKMESILQSEINKCKDFIQKHLHKSNNSSPSRFPMSKHEVFQFYIPLKGNVTRNLCP